MTKDKAKIIGTGSYLPEKILTNHDLEKMVETSDDWIVSRTGIKERRIAREDEYTSDMGIRAAKAAIEDAKLKAEDIDFILVATLKSPTTVQVQNRLVEGKHILLASGSEPISLPNVPFDEKRIVSSTGALGLKTVPQKMLVIGAGVIGVELGSVYQRLGSEVIFIEFLDRICPAFDPSLSKALQKALTRQGMTFHLLHKVIKADPRKVSTQEVHY